MSTLQSDWSSVQLVRLRRSLSLSCRQQDESRQQVLGLVKLVRWNNINTWLDAIRCGRRSCRIKPSTVTDTCSSSSLLVVIVTCACGSPITCKQVQGRSASLICIAHYRKISNALSRPTSRQYFAKSRPMSSADAQTCWDSCWVTKSLR